MNQDISYLQRLNRPEGPVDVVLDTDTYNEIDDQYALAYLIKSEEKLHLKAVYAAPFHNEKSSGPEDGMEKSYQEIHHILDLMEKQELKEHVYRGSAQYLPDEETPVASDAAAHLAALALGYTPEKPLYVIAIGAITNVASALLMKPEIKDRIVLIWLGGNAHEWPDNKEFNLFQDVPRREWYSAAAQLWYSFPAWAWYPLSPPAPANWRLFSAAKTSCAII